MRRPLFRKDEIVRICRGREVLHLGFIQHTLWREKRAAGDWLHDKILSVAKRVVGLDYLADEVDAIRETIGCECVAGDAMALDEVELAGTFDVIVCGELIEHVENPGLLLRGLHRFCSPDTLVVVTTPNPWCAARVELIRDGRPEPEWLNPEHVAWYSAQTLRQLLERCDFRVDRGEYYYAESEPPLPAAGPRREWKKARRYLRFLRVPEAMQDGLFFVARPR